MGEIRYPVLYEYPHSSTMRNSGLKVRFRLGRRVVGERTVLRLLMLAWTVAKWGTVNSVPLHESMRMRTVL